MTGEFWGTAAWSGPDATTFHRDWSTRYRACLAGVNRTLLTAATALVKNADEQEQASA